MYLKRLDIHGFKSFANRTQLVFGPGVSCVVGPNGTGKTNVADALRWVLGEHASRTIRARKTEDVIFAGSDRRPPMGIAEVSITLDNSEHWLPIDFDEVVVARRAYRSGENEYLINNSKVRLRDVVDLFMRAEVGQNSYAFLGQGMVEQVLSLRPEDRRALIEEAADVRVYRTKLEDARNKLKATRENTERVRMLVREIEPRINQLQRQAGRAVRYQELTKELATLLHAWYAHQWQETNDLLLAAMTTHDQCVAEAERVRTQARSYDEGLQQLRVAIERRTAEIAEREGTLRSLEEYARDLERRLALDAERNKMLSGRLDELAAELASLRADLAQSPAGAAVPADVREAQERLAAAREELEAAREHAAALDGELSALRASASAHEHVAARALAAVEDRTRRIEELTDQVARLHRQRDAAIEEQQKATNEARACEDEIGRLTEQSAALAARIEDTVTARQAEAEIITELRRQQAETEEETREMMARVEALAARLQVMEELDFKPQPPDAGIRAVLEAGGILPREHVPEDIELAGVIGLVRELVRPVPGLERAVDAALAENVHAVVFERESELRRAVEMLTSGDTGRATMYALDAVQDVRPLHLIKERGILGVASTMVRCHPRHRRLIDSLIGRVVVVEDISMAHRVVRRGLAQAVATLDGVLVRPIGAVSAGTSRAIEAALVRAREVGDLPEEIERLRPEIERRQAVVRDLIARQEKAQARIDELAASGDALRAERARIDAEIAAANVRLSTLRVRIEALAESRQRYDNEASDVQQERERFEVDRAVKADEARAATEAEEQARARIAEAEAESRAALTRAQELAEEVARLDALVRGAGGVTQGELEARERLQR
ncbi:MAG TPA: AAA family ATPase, partial [Dehalococcoidia bacterium]|nr:AAA family ATPase [Dehalococcoidia bacterium]